MLQKMSNSIRQLIHKFIARYIPHLALELKRHERQEILGKLTKSGDEIILQMPLVITGNVRLGNKVSLAAYVHIWGEGGVEIGNEVMVDTAIVTLTHDKQATSMWKTVVKNSVIIHDNVWIGAHCVILPGVEIGSGSIIGAGSIVTQSVPPNTVSYGSPAESIRKRI